jgi:hypothetical protein
MLRTDDPAQLTPEQRFHELARLLAVGLRRLLSRPSVADSASLQPQQTQKTTSNWLDLSADLRLSVHTG